MKLSIKTVRVMALVAVILVFASACGRATGLDALPPMSTTSTTEAEITINVVNASATESVTSTTAQAAVVAAPMSTSTTVTSPEEISVVSSVVETTVATVPPTTAAPVADPVSMVVLGKENPVELTWKNQADWWDPSGPAIGLVAEFGGRLCESGEVWAVGHSHLAGALTEMVIVPELDYADRGSDSPGLQIGDVVRVNLADGSFCEYVAVEFNPTATGISIPGSPAVAWPKTQFGDSTTSPIWEWQADADRILWLSTSGGPAPERGQPGHRPNLDVMKLVGI